jgi:hypothetical protein
MCGCDLFFLLALLALKATGIQFCRQFGGRGRMVSKPEAMVRSGFLG